MPAPLPCRPAPHPECGAALRSCNALHSEGLIKFTQGLIYNTMLVALNVAGNEITDGCAPRAYAPKCAPVPFFCPCGWQHVACSTVSFFVPRNFRPILRAPL